MPNCTFCKQTDARSDQDELLETLHALVDRTCHALLGYGTDVAVTSARVWDAWHAVRRCFRHPSAAGGERDTQGVIGFDAQVCVAIFIVPASRACASDCLTCGGGAGIFTPFGMRAVCVRVGGHL